MNKIIPIFKTEGSVGKSLITIEDETEIKKNYPISIFAIVKKYNLDKIIVIDDSFIYFPKLYKNSNKYNTQLIFGINFNICNDVNDKSEKSLFTNCKVSIVIKNSQGYKDLLKLHNAINGELNNFYYFPRGDWNIIKKYWTENLELIMPSYDNFLHKNLLNNGQCIPDFGKIKPIFFHSQHEQPYNLVLNDFIYNFVKNNNFELQEIHNISYYKDKDYKYYNILRVIDNRSKFNKPNLDFMCSDSFSWESYCGKVGLKFNE